MNRTLRAASLSLFAAFAACTLPERMQPPAVLEAQVLDSTSNVVIETIQPTRRFPLPAIYYSGLTKNVRDVVAGGNRLGVCPRAS